MVASGPGVSGQTPPPEKGMWLATAFCPLVQRWLCSRRSVWDRNCRPLLPRVTHAHGLCCVESREVRSESGGSTQTNHMCTFCPVLPPAGCGSFGVTGATWMWQRMQGPSLNTLGLRNPFCVFLFCHFTVVICKTIGARSVGWRQKRWGRCRLESWFVSGFVRTLSETVLG